MLSTANSGAQGIIHPWDVYRITFTTNKTYPNPYADIPVTRGNDLLQVNFEGTRRGSRGKKTHPGRFLERRLRMVHQFCPSLPRCVEVPEHFPRQKHER